MGNYTWDQLYREVLSRGANLAETVIGRMMDDLADDTGVYPKWGDQAPAWAVKAALYY